MSSVKQRRCRCFLVQQYFINNDKSLKFGYLDPAARSVPEDRDRASASGSADRTRCDARIAMIPLRDIALIEVSGYWILGIGTLRILVIATLKTEQYSASGVKNISKAAV